MLVFRWAMLLLLVAAAVLFALYAGTGQERYKRYGFTTLKWTLMAGVVFFVVLALERVFDI